MYGDDWTDEQREDHMAAMRHEVWEDEQREMELREQEDEQDYGYGSELDRDHNYVGRDFGWRSW